MTSREKLVYRRQLKQLELMKRCRESNEKKGYVYKEELPTINDIAGYSDSRLLIGK